MLVCIPFPECEHQEVRLLVLLFTCPRTEVPEGLNRLRAHVTPTPASKVLGIPYTSVQVHLEVRLEVKGQCRLEKFRITHGTPGGMVTEPTGQCSWL